ncbi:MAG: hypothetical protein KAR79_00700 [Simkaniaceae bacterium]|nr:hypothetical protein [Simkaniaceae bacterium]
MSMFKKIFYISALLAAHTIHSLEMTATHTQGDGVGYKKQYSKLGLYHAFEQTAVQPFIDLRYLIFENGKQGANLGAGLGYQFEKANRLSAYAYFDLRETPSAGRFEQITAGLSYTHPLNCHQKDYGELCAYLNGYFFGSEHKTSKTSRSCCDSSKKTVETLGMDGTNFELGYFSNTWNRWNYYIAAGAYYFTKSSQDTFGGDGKLRIIFNDLIHLQVRASKDQLFGTNVNGTIGIRIPFKAKSTNKAVKTQKQLHPSRPVERFEPIVISRRTTRKRKSCNPTPPCATSNSNVAIEEHVEETLPTPEIDATEENTTPVVDVQDETPTGWFEGILY